MAIKLLKGYPLVVYTHDKGFNTGADLSISCSRSSKVNCGFIIQYTPDTDFEIFQNMEVENEFKINKKKKNTKNPQQKKKTKTKTQRILIMVRVHTQ